MKIWKKTITLQKKNNDEISNRSAQEELGGGDEVHSREQEIADRLGKRGREAEVQLSRPLSKSEKNLSDGKETETGMDNEGTVGGSSLRELVGEQPQGRRIEQVLIAGNRRGGSGASKGNERQTWNKGRFLETLEVAALGNGTWIDNIKTIADKRLKGGFENEPYIAKDGKRVIKVNNFAFLNDDIL
jgi:hypothetical protein